MADSSSIRFGLAERGATPTNPACMVKASCDWADAAFALASSSVVDEWLVVALCMRS